MAKRSKPTNSVFGKLVMAKLGERGWSQRQLGNAIDRGPSYVSYIIQGENPNASGRKFGLRPDVVARIAAALDIPLDESYRVAGIDERSIPKNVLPADMARAQPKKRPAHKKMRAAF